MTRIALTLSALLWGASLQAAGMQDVVCDDTTRMERSLSQTTGAERHGMGLREPDALLEIWIVPHSGDWTLVQNYASGTSCILAMGEAWQTLGPVQTN